LDSKDDLDAIYQIALFLHAAYAVGPSQAGSVSVPGLKLIAADQESVGPSTISLSVTAAGIPGDAGMAIRSQSGTCLWYAFVKEEERYGTGEPCTGTSALNGSSPNLPADSPWQVAADQPVDSDPQAVFAAQAKATQSTLRNTLVAAKVFFTDAGNFTAASPEALQEIEPSIVFVRLGAPSVVPDTVSVAFTRSQFGAAALSKNGTCYWIAENLAVSGTHYGQGEPCTGMNAMTAASSRWPTDG
jgi:hypothetical protein